MASLAALEALVNDRQRRRKHERRRHASMRGTGKVTMHFESALPADATPQAHLGLEVRNAAERALCCLCGRRPYWFKVVRWDSEHPKVERIDGPEDAPFPHAVIVHKADCPAASPEVDRALKAAYS
jgi:hypothetical protein